MLHVDISTNVQLIERIAKDVAAGNNAPVNHSPSNVFEMAEMDLNKIYPKQPLDDLLKRITYLEREVQLLKKKNQ